VGQHYGAQQKHQQQPSMRGHMGFAGQQHGASLANEAAQPGYYQQHQQQQQHQQSARQSERQKLTRWQ
jgi:hypothetical protein